MKRLRKPVPEILDDLNVRYVSVGKNVKKGNVNVPCPFCGSDDPSEHMGIGIENGYWSCWRNQSHRGRNLPRLLIRLAQVTYFQAQSQVYGEYVPEDFNMAEVSTMLADDVEQEAPAHAEPLLYPKEFRTLERQALSSHKYRGYMKSRGLFHRSWEYYDLQYSVTGDQSGRVIFPHFYAGELMTWTGRAITPNARLRYRALPVEDSILPTKSMLYNYDNAAEGGDALVIVEGPVDTLKIDWYGKRYGIRAVGLGNASVEESQVAMLNTLLSRGRFKKVAVMLDATAYMEAIRVSESIAPACQHVRGPTVVKPIGAEDPGAMSRTDVVMLAKQVRS